MSRVGKKEIKLPAGAQAQIVGRQIRVKGAKGELSFDLHDAIDANLTGNVLTFAPRNETAAARAAWGTSRARVANMVEGVTNGYSRTLELVGVGYKAVMKGQDLTLSLGYSHEIVVPARNGIKIEAVKPTEIRLSGIDKEALGQIAAEIRSLRPPEPYKGKGVKHQGERIRRKEGKKK